MRKLCVILIQIFIMANIFILDVWALAPDTAEGREALLEYMKKDEAAVGRPVGLSDGEIERLNGDKFNVGFDFTGASIQLPSRETYTYGADHEALFRKMLYSQGFLDVLTDKTGIKSENITEIKVNFLAAGMEKAVFKVSVIDKSGNEKVFKIAHFHPAGKERFLEGYNELKKEYPLDFETAIKLLNDDIYYLNSALDGLIVPYWAGFQVGDEYIIAGEFDEGEVLKRELGFFNQEEVRNVLDSAYRKSNPEGQIEDPITFFLQNPDWAMSVLKNEGYNDAQIKAIYNKYIYDHAMLFGSIFARELSFFTEEGLNILAGFMIQDMNFDNIILGA
ncbi:hypothetical protein KKC59_02600, partial [bacterium]|nr:hypothetical protein [bacterium]